MLLANGQRVDRYIVEGKVGEGGVATVYRVRHLTLGTRHALKVLTLAAPDVRARLLQEGQAQAGMGHDNVVAVTDVLDVNGAPGLLMEFVEGTTLDRWLDRHEPTLDEAMAVFRGICAGIGHAHQRGIVHRDLKPGNVLLALAGGRLVPKVTDFGLARMVQRGAFKSDVGATLGTPGYMAPEQARDASAVDRRADLWSLGCILYRLTVGVEPFGGEDLRDILHRVEEGDVVPPRTLRPRIPERVAATIERLLTVDPAGRPPDVPAVLAMLGETATPGPSWLERTEGVFVARVLAEEAVSEVPTLTSHLRTPRRWLAPDEQLVPGPPVRGRGVVLGMAALGAFLLGGLVLLAAVVATAVFVSGGSPPGERAEAVRTVAPATEAMTVEPPAPVAPAPMLPVPAKVRPQSPPRLAAVAFSGAEHLWLEPVGGGAAVHDLASVPAGRYRILAVFAASPEVVPAGEIVVSRGGAPVEITCDRDLMRCRARP